MAIKLNGSTSGSVSLDAPADTSPSGTDVTLTLPTSAGSSGQYLQTNGSGTLSWQTIAEASGTILNTWTATDTSGRSTTSETFGANSNTASVTLTPASADSKFLVFVRTTMRAQDGNDGWMISLFRDSTNLAPVQAQGFFQGNSAPGISATTFPVTIIHLDSPNTTSQIVYQPQFRTVDYDNDGFAAYMGYTGNGGSSGPGTTITVFEIGG